MKIYWEQMLTEVLCKDRYFFFQKYGIHTSHILDLFLTKIFVGNAPRFLLSPIKEYSEAKRIKKIKASKGRNLGFFALSTRKRFSYYLHKLQGPSYQFYPRVSNNCGEDFF